MTIINAIIGYWIVSFIIEALRMYSGWRSFKKFQREKPEHAQTILHFKNIGKQWISKMSRYDKVLVWLVCIPLGIMFLIAPPIFLPFDFIMMIASIPKNIQEEAEKT